MAREARSREGVSELRGLARSTVSAALERIDFSTDAASLRRAADQLRVAARRLDKAVVILEVGDHLTGPRPHGVSCPGCIVEGLCNHCGQPTAIATGRCTNGRCRECCPMHCGRSHG